MKLVCRLIGPVYGVAGCVVSRRVGGARQGPRSSLPGCFYSSGRGGSGNVDYENACF